MGSVVAVANQKGGVAKTTTVISLAGALAKQGYRVLLCDMDPQANLTLGFGIEPEELARGMFHVLTGECAITDAIVADVFDGVARAMLAKYASKVGETTSRSMVILPQPPPPTIRTRGRPRSLRRRQRCRTGRAAGASAQTPART